MAAGTAPPETADVTSTRRALCLLVVALWLPLGACSGGNSGGGSAWARMDDIDYLLAGDLPEGWVVNTATLRPGRPRSEWTYRADVYTDAERDAFVVVGAEVGPPGRPFRGTASPPGAPDDADPDDYVYVLAYLALGWDAEEPSARQVRWGSGSAGLNVAHLGADPDDELIRRVAEQHSGTKGLDFGTPSAVTEAGFEFVGSIIDTEDVPDYTLVWTSEDAAGRTREEASETRQGAPSLSINVSSPMYVHVLAGPGATLSDDPDKAELKDDDGRLDLAFLRDGIPVTVGGSGVEPEVVRALARSLRQVSPTRWEDELGDRLLIDEPEPR